MRILAMWAFSVKPELERRARIFSPTTSPSIVSSSLENVGLFPERILKARGVGESQPRDPTVVGPHLLGEKGNDAQGYFLARLRKARLALEELEKHCEAEPGRPGLVGQQFSLAGQQSPLRGEFVGLPIAPHFQHAPLAKRC